jgi:hypothetical protein
MDVIVNLNENFCKTGFLTQIVRALGYNRRSFKATIKNKIDHREIICIVGFYSQTVRAFIYNRRSFKAYIINQIK